jgi:hypothetical protein
MVMATSLDQIVPRPAMCPHSHGTKFDTLAKVVTVMSSGAAASVRRRGRLRAGARRYACTKRECAVPREISAFGIVAVVQAVLRQPLLAHRAAIGHLHAMPPRRPGEKGDATDSHEKTNPDCGHDSRSKVTLRARRWWSDEVPDPR